MTNKFDELSYSNENNDQETVVSVIEPKKPTVEAPKKKPTIFKALFANFKQDKELIYPSEGAVLPNLTRTLNTLINLIFISAVMVAMWYLIDKVVFVPIALIFLTIAIPSLVLIFYFDFDINRKIPLGKLFILMIVGALCYLAITQIMTEMLYIFLSPALVDSVIMPVISNGVMFFVIFLAANFFKGENVRDYFLIVAFFVMGFVMCMSFTKGFSALFVSNKFDQTTYYNIRVIVDDEEMLAQSLRNLLDNLLYDYIVLPILYSCWGTIYAYLVYYLIDSRKNRNNIPKSMYLLILLVIILNILAIVDTAMVTFNVILKFTSCAISIYILIKLLNYSFDEEPPQLSIKLK